MKKILSIAFALMLILTLAFCVYAEEITETTDQTSNEIIEETTNQITTILGISGTVGIGAIIITVIAFFLKNLSKLKSIVDSLVGAFKTIFSKDGKIENVPQAFKAIDSELKSLGKDFNNELAKLQEELAKEKESNEQFKHILSVFIINSTYLNPYAKNELIQLICGEKKFGDTVGDTIKQVDNAVIKAKEAEIKPETPNLDKVISEV